MITNIFGRSRKKGTIDYGPWFLVIITLILIGLLAYYLVTKVTASPSPTGAPIQELLVAHAKERQVLDGIDTMAPLAVEKSLRELFDRAGLENTATCGTKDKVVVWQTNNASCYHQGTFTAIQHILAKNLNASTASFNGIPGIVFPQNNYEFFIDTASVVGIALEPVQIPIYYPDDGQVQSGVSKMLFGDQSPSGRVIVGRVYTNPSFRVRVQTNLDMFSALHTMTDSIIEQCGRVENQSSCIEYQESLLKRDHISVTTFLEKEGYYFFTAQKTDTPLPTPLNFAVYVEPLPHKTI